MNVFSGIINAGYPQKFLDKIQINGMLRRHPNPQVLERHHKLDIVSNSAQAYCSFTSPRFRKIVYLVIDDLGNFTMILHRVTAAHGSTLNQIFFLLYAILESLVSCRT